MYNEDNVKDLQIKELKEIILQTKNNYEEFFNKTDDFIFVLDLQGNIITFNTTAYKRLGYTKEELTGKPIHFVHPLERREEVGKIVEELISGAKDVCIIPVATKNGIQIPVETKIYHGFWDSKPAILGVSKDKSQLAFSEEKFSKLFNINPSACGLTDLNDSKYVEVNEAFYTLFGFEKDEVIGRTPLELGIITSEASREIMSNAINGNTINIEANLKAKNGDIKNVLLSSENIIVQNNRYRYTVVHDITQRKLAEQELLKAKLKAEESDRLKTAFLANLSHEIRTPLNGIMGFAELLKDPDLSEDELGKYIAVIEEGGKRMLNTINDLVNISKIESGNTEINISESNINMQIENILAIYKRETEQLGIKIFSNKSLPDSEVNISTDWVKVTSVLINLVKNAIKFTTKGYIEIGYLSKGKNIEFYVKDTGIGIPDDQKKLIFERFRQGSESITRKYEGAGLGLTISQAYIEILGGKIWVESKEGTGSIFYFTIPYSDTEIEEKVKNIMDMKILIVEDEEASDVLISLAVKDMAREILHVKTGIDAIEACRNNADIDLVLMDIKLFKMNGYEATRQIRQFNKDVVIIAQTAYGLTGDREKALEAGCDDYISKPLNISQLRGLIQNHFNK